MDLFDSNKNFSVMDIYGTNTLAFQINTTLEGDDIVCSIEKLKSFIEQADNGFKKTFFFNPDPQENERKEVVFLTLKPGEAVLNGAEFLNGQLNVGKKPDTIKYSSLKVQSDTAEYREFKYTPNFKRPITIVDPEVGDEVRPVVFFDTETNEVKAKIKLLPHKSYIAIEVSKDV